MKIIIVGTGKMGYSLAAQLAAEDHDVTVIDRNEEALSRAANTLDVLCVRGNGAAFGALEEAGADEADILIAVTGRDEMNIVACVAGKRLGAAYTIARIRDADYSADFPKLKQTLGIDMAINPEFSTAVEISRLLRFPSAENIDTFYRGRVELVSFHAQADDFFVGKPLHTFSKRLKRLSILFCALEREDELLIPNGATVFEPGDKLYIIGDNEGVSDFFRALGRLAKPPRSVLIAGGGRIGSYLAKALVPMNMHVTLVERDEAVCRQLGEMLDDVLILHGDGTDQTLLEDENLAAEGAFVALTDQDESNLITALYALQLGVPKVVVKINRQNYDGVARAIGLESVVSPKHITAEYILQTVRGMQDSRSGVMQALYKIAGGRAEAVEFVARANTKNLGVSLRELTLKPGILVAVLVHGGVIKIPDGDSRISEGDNVVVISAQEAILDLNDIFREETDYTVPDVDIGGKL